MLADPVEDCLVWKFKSNDNLWDDLEVAQLLDLISVDRAALQDPTVDSAVSPVKSFSNQVDNDIVRN